jgi:hypothetical protein
VVDVVGCSVFGSSTFNNEGRGMYGNNYMRVFSGLALLITCVIVVAQSLLRNEFANQLYYGTTLIAVFGYIFLTSRTKEEERDSPWWW